MDHTLLELIFNESAIGYAYQKINDDKKTISIINANEHFNQIFSSRTGDNLNIDELYRFIPNNRKLILEIINNKTKQKLNYPTKDHFYMMYLIPTELNHLITVIYPLDISVESLFLLENVFQMLEDSDEELIYFIDLNYNITFLSDKSKLLLGYNKSDRIKLSLDKFLTPDSLRKVKEQMIYDFEAVKTKNKYHMSRINIEVYRRDGRIIQIEHVGKFIRDNKGNPIYLVGFSRETSLLKHINERLKSSQEQLQLILNSTTEGIFGIDLQGICTFCNKSAVKLLGYTSEDQLMGEKIFDLIDPENRQYAKTKNNNLNYDDNLIGEYFVKKDNTTFYVDCFFHEQKQNGKLIGYVVTFYDITDRKKVKDKLIESERSKTVLLSNLPGLAYRCLVDRNWTMLFVSDGCYDLTGYRPEALLYNRDISFNDIITVEYREKLWDTWQRVLKNKERFKEEYTIITADGNVKWVYEQGQGVYDKDGNVEAIEGFITDISRQIRKQEEITYLLHHDYLTGVYNRIYFDMESKRLDKEEYLPFSIMVGDINGLKLINDAFGHDEGDKLIIKTAELIKQCLKENQILARVGGDEFAILLPNTNENEANMILKEIQHAFIKYNALSGTIFAMNISLGYETKYHMGQDLNNVRKLAEDYMYKRKLLERNSQHSSLITSIKTAMYENSHENESHAERLNVYSKLIGSKLNLSQNQLDELALLASLHDIGKIGVNPAILNKPGKLTNEEWVEVKKHPEIGYRIAMSTPGLVSIAKYILHHHERWDGKGYPYGLKNTEIPLLSRIVAVVDSYDAMTSTRVYRQPLSQEEAIQEIIGNSGTQFDPAIVECFLSIKDELEQSFNKIKK